MSESKILITKHPAYGIWRGMHARCYNPNCKVYPKYGGRGIKICDRWRGRNGFLNFIEDMGPRPAGRTSVERIDNFGDYCPENCKWSNQHEQNRNKRTNVFFEYDGKSLVLADWAKITGIKRITLWKRINKSGWSIEKALMTPVSRH